MNTKINYLLAGMLMLSAIVNAQFKTIKVGKQVWMAENLNVNIQGSWHYNEDVAYGQKYGRLYTWQAAKNACPSGWHLPSDDEWTQLVNYLGGEDVAGKHLKLEGTSGFKAMLGGFADGHSYRFIEVYGGYWSSTSYDDNHAWYRYFTKKDDSFTKTYFSKSYGFSIRCVKN